MTGCNRLATFNAHQISDVVTACCQLEFGCPASTGLGALLLQELGARPNALKNIAGAAWNHAIKKQRHEGKGGTATLLPHNIVHRRRSDLEGDACDTSWAEITLPTSQRVLLGNVYRQEDGGMANWTSIKASITKATNNAEGLPVIVGGDFNAHSESWGSDHTNSFGREIEDLCIALDLTNATAIFAPGQATMTPNNIRHDKISVLDLWLTTDISLISNITVDNVTTTGSDHLPVYAHLAVADRLAGAPQPDRDIQAAAARPMWRLSHADWDLFTKVASPKLIELKTFTGSIPAERTKEQARDHITVLTDAITSILREAADAAVPRQQPRSNPARDARPEWKRDLELPGLHKAFRHADRRWRDRRRTSQAAELHGELKAARAAFATRLKKSKRANWRRFASSVQDPENGKLSWAVFARSKGAGARITPYSVEDPSGKLPDSPEQGLQNLCRAVAANSTAPELKTVHDLKIAAEVSDWGEPDGKDAKSKPLGHAALVTVSKIRKMRKRLPLRKAGGPDGLLPAFLKHAPDAIDEILTTIFRLALTHGELPDRWRTALIYPLYKGGGKPGHSAKSWRPIALTCVLCKMIERFVNELLHRILRQRNILLAEQFGFRKGHAASDQLLRLHADIVDSVSISSKKQPAADDSDEEYDHVIMPERKDRKIKQHDYVPVCFLDIEAAFDAVWHDGLLFKLGKALDIENNFEAREIWTWIKAFLSDRTIRIVHGDYSSEEFIISAGVPQGAVISPILFAVFINDIPTDPKNYHVYLFADDVAIRPSKRRVAGEQQLARALRAMANWGDVWHLRFSQSKSNVILFHESAPGVPKPRPVTAFKLGNIQLECVPAYKYLGIWLAHDLRWNLQSDDVIQRLTLSCGDIARLCAFRQPPGIRVIRQLIRAGPIAQLTYGMDTWRPTTQEEIRRINNQLLRPIRAGLGLPRNSHGASAFIEADIQPVELLAHQAMLALAFRTTKMEVQNLARMAVEASVLEDAEKKRDRKPELRSVGRRIKEAQEALDLDVADIEATRDVRVATSAVSFARWDNMSDGKHLREVRKVPGLEKYHRFDPPEIATLRTRLRSNREQLHERLRRWNFGARGYSWPKGDASCWCRAFDAEHGGPVSETREHLILECEKYSEARAKCQAQLRKLGLDFELFLVLGRTDGLRKDIAVKALKLTASFLSAAWASRWEGLTEARQGMWRRDRHLEE
jgi:endonuclease/exonuclease/phosphatase family metal-dependent hydrolase